MTFLEYPSTFIAIHQTKIANVWTHTLYLYVLLWFPALT